MVSQFEMELPYFGRGFHLITDIINEQMPDLPESGICHLFIHHTSAALTINENADPTVRADFESFFSRLVPDKTAYFKHILEGDDDMPAHIKASLLGNSLMIPIAKKRLKLGMWQGIYLCEFRNERSSRRLTATILS